jgi:hypothetical protein
MNIERMIDYRAILDAIRADPRYRANLDWGRPRRGHPEGTVRAHIAEIERNLEALKPKLSEAEYWKVKVLLHTHDLMKADSDRGVPIQHPRSHASLARAFLAEFCADEDLLAMVQYHDEPYALWRQCRFKGTYRKDRFALLLDSIHDWNLFLAFVLADACTEGKSREPVRWFLGEVAGKVASRFSDADIL